MAGSVANPVIPLWQEHSLRAHLPGVVQHPLHIYLGKKLTYKLPPCLVSFPGKDEPNARSLVQPRARRESCLRKRSPVLRNVVILITTNTENDFQTVPGPQEGKETAT